MIDSCENVKVDLLITSQSNLVIKIAMCITTITMSTHINMKILTMLRNKIKLFKREKESCNIAPRVSNIFITLKL